MPLQTQELLHFKNPPLENAARHAWFPRAKEQLAAIAALPQGWTNQRGQVHIDANFICSADSLYTFKFPTFRE